MLNTLDTFAPADVLSPAEVEEMEAAIAGMPLMTDSEWVASQDMVAEEMASWEAEWKSGLTLMRPPWC